jgi:hypothetical protein
MGEVPASELGGKGCSDNSRGYSHWQPIYAERGITLIPCGDNKIPLVKNPQKFGRDASAEIANKFSDASAFGYYCGRSNGITVLDVDTTDERVLADDMSRHGPTPIVVRTGSGKFHALYRHNNERRYVRGWEGLPIDLLGAGLAIAPPSRTNSPRHLGRLITCCLTAHPEGADTIDWLIGRTVRFYRDMRATACAAIVSRSAFHVLASAPGGSFGRCR